MIARRLAVLIALFLLLPITPNDAAVRRRRAIAPPQPCTTPTLALALSRATVCAGEPVVLSWQASDVKASVTIDQIGANLPAAGSATVPSIEPRLYSGRAINACGTSPEATAFLSIQPSPTASLTTASASINQGSTTTLTLITANSTLWTLSSVLGNPLSATSGTGDGQRTVTYTGTRAGTDTVTLNVTGNCGTADRNVPISVVPSPTPQPPSGGLRCCDGSLSPTCFSCASKQGCCSGHGGVCGCP